MRTKAFFRSLFLTSLFSFAAPLLLIGGTIAILALLAYIPGLNDLSCLVINQVLQVLAVFGSGDALSGAVVIALACTLVGALFDTYSFYYQSLRNG